MTSQSTSLSMTGRQWEVLRAHLLQDDGLESVAFLLCGFARSDSRLRILTHRVILPPQEACRRTRTSVNWPTSLIVPLLEEAARRRLGLFKIHSHRIGGSPAFSPVDDRADSDLFASLAGWLPAGTPFGSCVMAPDGRIVARMPGLRGRFCPIDRVFVVGDDVKIWPASETRPKTKALLSAAGRKNAQAFGAGTTDLLSQLSIGIVGCSGTGSPTVEQLMRLGAGRLVLVDPDHIEGKNLNRILNSRARHVAEKVNKTRALEEAIKATGLGTVVEAIPHPLWSPKAIAALSTCDWVFGCVDSIDGRHILNRLATFYLQPYHDVGVRLDADGNGGIEQICGSVNYIQPGESSLLSRGVYTQEKLDAAMMQAMDPRQYARMRRERYIKGVNEERPAVISVNMLFSAFAVNDLLARLHPFRHFKNGEYGQFMYSLCNGDVFPRAETSFQRFTAWEKYIGRGDLEGLPLDMMFPSEIQTDA